MYIYMYSKMIRLATTASYHVAFSESENDHTTLSMCKHHCLYHEYTEYMTCNALIYLNYYQIKGHLDRKNKMPPAATKSELAIFNKKSHSQGQKVIDSGVT